ncbi:hypothetical protein FS749_002426 [Ceratobasidium sp. UAMH 11750]|nr:hypothetical protein FS749_002426 [Ceratobasidium sp. UAMH 11750]
MTSPATPSTHFPGQAGSTYQRWLRFRTRLSTRLWTTFVIAVLAISVARVPWLFPKGIELRQFPDEHYHYRFPFNKALLWTHLASVLPSAMLATVQFVPRFRARAIGLHRNTGQVVNVMSFVSVLTAWGMGRLAFGGDLATQSSVYLLGAMVLWSVVKAWSAIRRLQIDEHRMWIIRAWSYQAQVLTERLVMGILMVYVTVARGYYYAIPCDQVSYILDDQELYARDYPQCQAEWIGSRVTHVSIEANVSEEAGLGITAAARVTFGASMWIAILIHVLGTEYYLYKTKDESERLRDVSGKRQKARQALNEQHAGK